MTVFLSVLAVLALGLAFEGRSRAPFDVVRGAWRRVRLAHAADSAALLLGCAALWSRAHHDASIAARVGRDLAPWIDRLESGLVPALQHTVGATAVVAATRVAAVLPVATVVAYVLVEEGGRRRTSGVAVALWSTLAIALPVCAFFPATEPSLGGAAGAFASAFQDVGPVRLDARNDALLHLPTALLVALASVATGPRSRAVLWTAAAATAVCSVLAGEVFASGAVLALAAGLVAARVARRANAALGAPADRD
ncbi:MAG: hypothetical protein R3F34_14735 [Planctomycetota bacterium]